MASGAGASGAGAGSGTAFGAGTGTGAGLGAGTGFGAGARPAAGASAAASCMANSGSRNEAYGWFEDGSSSRPDQKAATSFSGIVTPRTILGVIARSSSVLSPALLVLLNSEPKSGMSPSKKTLFLLSVLVFWMSPPMMVVSPSLSERTVSRFLVPMVTTVVAWSVPMVSLCRMELTSRPSFMDTSLFNWMVGSAFTFTPTSTYWTFTLTPPPEGEEVVVIGTRVPTLNFAFSLFFTLIFGFERVSPLERVLPKLKVALGTVK